jgi:hypothetical protein
MGRHVAEETVECPRCGGATSRIYVAESRPLSLRFSSSLVCRSCSYAEEADGPELTEAARSAFYASEGRWSVHIRDLGSHRAEALRVLREIRTEPVGDLLRIVREGNSLSEGTLVEVEAIADALRVGGTSVDLRRLEL